MQEAIDGEAAIAQWQTWQPHLIWMDMRMPVMDGETAIQQIRALELQLELQPEALADSATAPHQAQDKKSLPSQPALFEENKNIAINSGCDDFVSKPFQAAAVFEKMAQHLDLCYQCETPANL